MENMEYIKKVIVERYGKLFEEFGPIIHCKKENWEDNFTLNEIRLINKGEVTKLNQWDGGFDIDLEELLNARCALSGYCVIEYALESYHDEIVVLSFIVRNNFTGNYAYALNAIYEPNK